MLWVVLVIISAFIYSIVNIIDKAVISNEVKDPIIATFVYAAATFVMFGAIGFFVDVSLSFNSFMLIFLTGIIVSIGVFLYYYLLKKGEVSTLIPFFSIFPVFVVIMAYLFLGEELSLIKYVGMGILVFGAFMISLNDHKLKFGFNRFFILSIVTVFIAALVIVLIKYLTFELSVLKMLFWLGMGNGVIAFLLIIFHHPHLRKKGRKGVKHLAVSNILTVVGDLFALFAISLGSVSLVSALGRVKLLFVFFEASFLSVFYPKMLKEKITKSIFAKKLFAIIIIIVGAALVI